MQLKNFKRISVKKIEKNEDASFRWEQFKKTGEQMCPKEGVQGRRNKDSPFKTAMWKKN